MRTPFLTLVIVGAVAWSDRPAAADDKLAMVEGAITYKGVAVPNGTIIFHLPDDQFVGAKIKDGKYRVDRVPAGTAKVTITSGKVRLPAKFAGPETSGLTIEVKAGKATFDIRLSD